MKASLFIVILAAAGAVGVCRAQDAAASGSACKAEALPTLQSLWLEVRTLRAELLADRRVLHQSKAEEFEKQLSAVAAQRQQLDLQQASRTGQLTAVETQLGKPDLEKNERDELEAEKAQLVDTRTDPSDALRNSLSQREARLRGLLSAEEQNLLALEQLARQLSVNPK